MAIGEGKLQSYVDKMNMFLLPLEDIKHENRYSTLRILLKEKVIKVPIEFITEYRSLLVLRVKIL